MQKVKATSIRIGDNYATSPEDPYYLRNRPVMLQKVHKFWIKDLLEKSLYAVARLELGLTTKPDAVEWDTWNVLVQRPDKTPQPLPPRTRISTKFDEFGRTLLILGAPGTGKTTLLLELTKDLLARAEQDPNHPLPVVFHLSSWAVRQHPLPAWLVDELVEHYEVPRKHAKTWIDRDLILPLLDGLDEVAPACRSACAEAINAFRQEHGLVPLAVCSRLSDYEALTVKLRLQEALIVKPLIRQQIDRYLAQAGAPLTGVRAALQNDETLWELLDTPLMLSIVALAYQGRLAAEIQTAGTLEERRTHLFAAYTEAMFTRRGKPAPYSRQQTVLWLGWLATAMARQNQSVFYLEWLQPKGVLGRIPQWIVFHGTAFLSRLVVGLVAGLAEGLSDWLRGVLVATLVYMLVSGLKLGLKFGLVFGLVVGLVGGLIYGLVVTGLVTGEITTRSRPNEGMRRSWRNALLSVLVVGLNVGLVVGLNVGLVVGLGSGLVGGLAYGLVYGLVVGLVVGLGSGLVGGLAYGLAYGLVYGLVVGLGSGLVGGLVGGLKKGGYAYFQHLMLRFLLWRNNYTPWHYVRFLDYAAERVFLRKVGGGYVFIHRMLLEYFATLYPSNLEYKDKASEPFHRLEP